MHINATTIKVASRALVVTALLAFSTMISLWWTGNHVGSQHGSQHQCVAAAIQGVVCPEQMNAALLLAHLNPFRDALMAGSSVLTLLLVAVMLAIAALVKTRGDSSGITQYWRRHTRHNSGPPVDRSLQRWLARLQLSPTSV